MPGGEAVEVPKNRWPLCRCCALRPVDIEQQGVDLRIQLDRLDIARFMHSAFRMFKQVVLSKTKFDMRRMYRCWIVGPSPQGSQGAVGLAPPGLSSKNNLSNSLVASTNTCVEFKVWLIHDHKFQHSGWPLVSVLEVITLGAKAKQPQWARHHSWARHNAKTCGRNSPGLTSIH